MELDRAGLLADTSLTGRAWCRAHSDLLDDWLARSLQIAAGSVAAHGVALVAVGGYGRAAEVAFLPDPDLKLGRGGLRDGHALGWAEAARRILFDTDDAELEGPSMLLLDCRVGLQRHSGRADSRLLLQDQDAVTAALG